MHARALSYACAARSVRGFSISRSFFSAAQLFGRGLLCIPGRGLGVCGVGSTGFYRGGERFDFFEIGWTVFFNRVSGFFLRVDASAWNGDYETSREVHVCRWSKKSAATKEKP